MLNFQLVPLPAGLKGAEAWFVVKKLPAAAVPVITVAFRRVGDLFADCSS
jgi:hypothetical protein